MGLDRGLVPDPKPSMMADVGSREAMSPGQIGNFGGHRAHGSTPSVLIVFLDHDCENVPTLIIL